MSLKGGGGRPAAAFSFSSEDDVDEDHDMLDFSEDEYADSNSELDGRLPPTKV